MTRTQKRAVWTSLPIVAACVAALLALHRCGSAQRQRNAVQRMTLANGATVILFPIAGADQVAVESFYTVGFFHEPKGMTQAAHLVEHLVCQGATKSYAAGQSMGVMNQKGMANAETLPAFTHYDYVLPARDLELALQIEGERLTSLQITPDLIRKEAPKCYQEADLVERNPQSGMLKHAFMVLSQAWRFRAEEALVRGGLEQMSVEDLTKFHHAHYRPENLLVVVVGGFDGDGARQLVETHLAAVPRIKTQPGQLTAWAEVAKEATVRWDSKVRAVSLAFPPPEDTVAREALSLWGNLLTQRLMADRQIQSVADAVFCTNQQWSVGTLPFFVYATVKPTAEVTQVRQALEGALQQALAQPLTANDMAQLRAMATQPARTQSLTWAAINKQAETLAAQMGQPPGRAAGMVLGNVPLHLGMEELLREVNSPTRLTTPQERTPDGLHRLVREALEPGKQFVTVLMPG